MSHKMERQISEPKNGYPQAIKRALAGELPVNGRFVSEKNICVSLCADVHTDIIRHTEIQTYSATHRHKQILTDRFANGGFYSSLYS